MGTELTVYEQTFGALSQDPQSPYSRISVANSSFSLDPFVGCPGRCAYCVAASSARDLRCLGADVRRVIRPSIPRELFAGKELVEALVSHPGFIPDRSVVGIVKRRPHSATHSRVVFTSDVRLGVYQLASVAAG